MIDSSAFQGKKATYYTLGCKLNFSETSTFGKMLSDMGVVTAAKGEEADICLINTCSVTDVADHKCRQAIHRMVRENPGAFIIVTGCYAQLESERVSKIPGVDLVLGSNEKANLIQYLMMLLLIGLQALHSISITLSELKISRLSRHHVQEETVPDTS